MSANKITIGIIGGGFGKRVILPVCLRHPRLQTKWLATRRTVPANIPTSIKITHRWQDIVEDPKVHAVIIATPHDMHAEQVRVSLATSKHVLCEKPLALGAKEAILLAKQREKTQLVGMMDYSFRFIPERRLFQELVTSGLIGNLRLLRLSFFRDDFERWPSRWYYDNSRGGGALISTGSHLVDAVHWLTQSDVHWVNAVIFWEGLIDVGFSAMLETKSGCICSIEVSHRIPGSGKHTIEAHGQNGSLLLESNGKVVKVKNGKVQEFTIKDRHRLGFGNDLWNDEPRLQPVARVIDKFVSHIISPSAVIPMSLWTAARNQAVIEAIRVSHREKKRIKITFPHH